MSRKIFKMRKYFWLSFFILGGFSFLIISLKAYAPTPTHISLSESSAKLYNQFYQNKLTDQEIEWLKQGTTEEDNAPRWLNHFYDPTTGKGWTGEGLMRNGKEMDPELVKKMQRATIGGDPVSALEWVNNQELQTSYDRYLGDQTFDRAVYEYVQGNKKAAFLALGHVFHLIQDMTVPAHTRQDTHSDDVLGDGDPYESWLKINPEHSKVKNFDEIISEYSSFKCSDIKNCLEQLAQYSNYYFFSKDTIEKYENPKIFSKESGTLDGDKGIIYYGKDDKGIIFPLIFLTKVGLSLEYSTIQSNYYSRLSKKAVMGGAEVLRLFREEVAKAEAVQQSGQIYEEGKPLSLKQTKRFFSPLGEILKFKTKAENFKDYIVSAVIKVVFPISSIAVSIQQNFAPPTTGIPPATVQTLANLVFAPPPVRTVSPNQDEPASSDNPSNEQPAVVESASLLSDSEINSVDLIVSAPTNEPVHIPYEPIHAPYQSPIVDISAPLSSDPSEGSPEPSEVSLPSGRETSEFIPSNRSDEPTSDPGAALPPSLSYGISQPIQPQSEPEPEIDSQPIVINEIAWMGTGASSQLNKDEWIELYNKSNQDINLENWILTGANDGPNIVFASSSIVKAKSYFLIERTDDDAISDVPADLVASFGNGLNDEGEVLELKDNNGNIIDKIGIKNEEWYAGNKNTRSTMERISPYLAGNLDSNWKTNDAITINGLAADGETKINGTPKQPNSSFNPNYSIPPYVWSKPKILDEAWAPAGAGLPSIAVNEQGHPFIIWNHDHSTRRNNIVFNFFNGDSWFKDLKKFDYITTGKLWGKAASPPSSIIYTASNQFKSVFAIGEYSPYSIYFSQMQNVQWSEPILISATSTSAYYSSIAVDSQNNNHIVWETVGPDFQIYYRFLDSSNNWSEIFRVSSSSEMNFSPNIIVDKNDQPHLVWFECKRQNPLLCNGIYYSGFQDNGWIEPIKIFDYYGQGIVHPDSPALAIDSNNQSHLVWSDRRSGEIGADIYYSQTENPASGWSAPVNISNSSSTLSRLPQIAIDSQNRMHVVWAETVGGKEQIFYSRLGSADSSQNENNGWTTPINVYLDSSINFSDPKLVIDSADRLHLVWSKWGSSSGVYYSTAKPN